ARQLRERPFVPRHLQRLRATRGRPVVVGDHGHTIRDLDNVLHSWDRLRLVRIEAGDLAAEDGAPYDFRGQQAWQLHVDTEPRAAVDLLGYVEPGERVAKHLEVLRILERHAARHRQRRGLVDRGAVLQGAAARR